MAAEGEDTKGRSQVWTLVLAYDGTEFHGWQVQPQRATVQGELRAAIARVTGEDVLPQGSGRTDAGVHATGQVASFALAAPIPERNLARALNRTLPAAIRVLAARHAPEGFHARHSAKRKTYEYRIFRGEICPPFLARYAYALNHPLDVAAMRSAARRVLGQHDFTSFAASDADRGERSRAAGLEGEAIGPEQKSTIEPPGNLRTISNSEWLQGPAALAANAELPGTEGHDMDMLVYRVRGNGFLHHMVRNLVGTFLDVGRGSLGEDEIRRILGERARASAGPTAPAHGLCLVEVEY
jgi:tRNA pseudouridine38-40 synthase